MGVPVEVHVVHAFCRKRQGGNPAGVVADRSDLSDVQKQAIATEVGFSETVFIGPSSTADVFLEFYTPTKQVPDCGHATLAAFGWLVEQGRITEGKSSREILAGRQAVEVERGGIFMEQPFPEWKPVGEPGVEESLGLSNGRVMDQALASTTLPFLLIEVRDRESLSSCNPEPTAIQAICGSCEAVGYYVYCQGGKPGILEVRMFAPAYGIQEESATGTAAGALVGYRHAIGVYPGNEYTVLQGDFMESPSPSTLEVRLDPNDERLWVGGSALVGETISINL